MFLSFCQWLFNTNFGTSIRESAYMYPIILSTHLIAIALFGGMVLMSDLRLLGWALKDLPVSTVVGGLRPWKRVGLGLILAMGFCLFSAKPVEYYHNPFFWTKITLLTLALFHAIAFKGSVYDKLGEMDRTGVTPRAKMAARMSLVLWLLIPCAGRAIGYYEVPKDLTMVVSHYLTFIR